MEILNLFALVFIVSKIVVHVGAHWPRAVERKYSRQIFKALGDQRLQQCTHLRGLQLEYADGVTARQQLVRRLVVHRNGINGESLVARFADHGIGIGDDIEVAQAKNVHLQ